MNLQVKFTPANSKVASGKETVSVPMLMVVFMRDIGSMSCVRVVVSIHGLMAVGLKALFRAIR